MSETLQDLKEKQEGAVEDFCRVYEDLEEEVTATSIKRLQAKIRALERELDLYKRMYEKEVENATYWEKQAEFMKKVKTIKIY